MSTLDFQLHNSNHFTQSTWDHPLSNIIRLEHLRSQKRMQSWNQGFKDFKEDGVFSPVVSCS